MPEEIGNTICNLKEVENTKFGDLKIISGVWKNNKKSSNQIFISVAWSGWGKVYAARAASKLSTTQYKNKKIDLLIFTGVAGSAHIKNNQWDVLIPNGLYQHDMVHSLGHWRHVMV